MSLTLKVRLRIAELQLSGMYAGIPFATGEPSPALPEGEERRREGVGEQVEVVGGQGLRTKAVGGWESGGRGREAGMAAVRVERMGEGKGGRRRGGGEGRGGGVGCVFSHGTDAWES
jgi:hypothetical protein